MGEDNKGCSYGKVTRERVDNFVKLFEKFVSNDFTHLVEDVKRLGRRPSWLVAGVLIVLTNLIVALALAQILK